MNRIRCQSGVEGWTCRLRENYGSYDTFLTYCESHNIHGRLGYRTADSAWEANPIIRGSVIPSDLQRQDEKTGEWIEVDDEFQREVVPVLVDDEE